MITAELRQRESRTVDRQVRSSAPTRHASGAQRPSSLGTFLGWLALCALLGAAYQTASGAYYTPRSTVGFSLGVIGSLMMLALLAYPLRKHVRWMQRWGTLKHWFRVHMILGILGPTLVLFHSTFHIRSTNAAVALFSMLGVVLSGIIGRFVYTKIHYGLYGSRASLQALQEACAAHSESTASRFHFAPRVEQWLRSFARDAQGERPVTTQVINLVTLGLKRWWLEWRCARELRRLLKQERHPEFRGGAREAIQLASNYLTEVQRVAQFSLYERLFSLWHVLHIPLIYILAASALFHVVAAYMY